MRSLGWTTWRGLTALPNYQSNTTIPLHSLSSRGKAWQPDSHELLRLLQAVHDAARSTNSTVVDLPNGKLGLRHETESGFYIILVLVASAAGELSWGLYSWKSESPVKDYIKTI